jgi:peptide/nickel transport system permease protein
MAVAEAYRPSLPQRLRRGRILNADTGRARNLTAASLLLLMTLIALLGPILAPHDPLQPIGMPQQAPGQGGFLLGTDSIGRDILSRVLYGWQSSWFAALGVIASGLVIGGAVGLTAGTFGGWVDNVLMRVTDAFLALPAPVFAIAVVAALGPSFIHTLLAVSIVWWPFYARIIRGEVRALAARPHVEAARPPRPPSSAPTPPATCHICSSSGGYRSCRGSPC